MPLEGTREFIADKLLGSNDTDKGGDEIEITQPAQIDKQEEQSFLDISKETIKSSYSKTPFGMMTKFAGTVGNYITGTDEEKDEIKKTVDKNTGGYISSITNLFTGKNDIALEDDEETHANKIADFQKTLDHNVIGTLGLENLSILGVEPFSAYDSGITYKKGTQEELATKISALDQEPLPTDIQGLVDTFNTKVYTGLNSRVDELIKQELLDNKLAQDATLVAARKEELINELYSEEESKYSTEKTSLENKISEYREGQRNVLIEEYVEPDEGYSAIETYQGDYSKNSATRTQQYIREEVVSGIMDSIIPKESWEALTAQDEGLKNMETKIESVLMRDYQHYYENLASVSDPETRARMKGLALPQLEARQKYFTNIIRDYQKNLSQVTDVEGFSDGDKQDLITKAYNNSYNLLDEDERNALITRDGTDTALDILYNTEEMKRRWDQGGVTGVTLALGNVIQVGIAGLGGVIGVPLSGTASAVFKTDDEKKIFYDEYELSTVQDSPATKVLKHTLYNIDDIAEVFVPVGVSGKLNVGAKVVDKGIKGLRTLTTKLDALGELNAGQKLVKRSANGLKVGVYGSRGIVEGFPANVLINKTLRTANTDASAYVDIVGDFLLEPVFHVVGKQAGEVLRGSDGIARAEVGTIANNYFAQNAMSFILGETKASDAAKDLIAQAAVDGIEITNKEAYSYIRQSRDLIYGTTSKQVTDIFNKNDIATLYKNIIENKKALEKIAEVGADKIYTPEGTILKLENLTTEKFKTSSEIDRAFKLADSSNSADKKLGVAMVDKLAFNATEIVKGNLNYQSGFIKLSKNQLSEQVNKIETMVSSITSEKDLDLKRTAITKLYSYLTDLKNSNVNKAKQTKAVIHVFDPISASSISIPLENINRLAEFEGTGTLLSDIQEQGILTVDKERALTLGLKNEGVYKTSGDVDNILTKMRNNNKDFFDFFIKGLQPGNKGTYSTGSKKLTVEQIISNLENIFPGKVGTIDINAIKKANPGKGFGRDEIAIAMKKEDSVISIAHGTLTDSTDPTIQNDIFYIGGGKQLIDKGFDLNGGYKDYHKKSSEIFKDILSFEDIDKGIEFALPIQNISKFEILTPGVKQSIVSEKLKEAGYLSDLGEPNETGVKIQKVINKYFKGLEGDTLETYTFEVFTSKLINNFDLYENIFKDIDLLKQGVDVSDTSIMNSVEGLNDLINSFASKRAVKRSGDKHKAQFNLNKYKTEASKRYDEIQLNRKNNIATLEYRKRILDNKITTKEERLLIENQKTKLDNDIKKLKQESISKDDYIKSFVDKIYSDGYDLLFKKKISEALELFEGVKSRRIKSAADMKDLTKAISDNKIRLEELKTKRNSGSLNETQLKSLRDDLKSASETKKELESKLNEITSKIDNEVSVMKGDPNFSKEQKALLEKFQNQKSFKPKQLFELFTNFKKELSESMNFNDWMFDTMVTKINSSTGSLFSRDAIKQVSKEFLQESNFKFVDNQIDYDFAKDENPILKAFSSALTGSANTESDNGLILLTNIKKEFKGESETLTDLYFENKEFQDKIKSFIISVDNKNISPEAIKSISSTKYREFKKWINSYLDGVEYKVMKDGKKISDAEQNKLLFNQKMYSKLYSKIKSLNNKTNTNTVLLKKEAEYGFDLILKENQISDRVLFTEELSELMGGNYRTIQIGSVNNLKSLKVNVGGKEVSLSSIMNKKFDKAKINEATYFDGEDVLNKIIQQVNNYNFTDVGVEKSMGETLRRQLGLDENEYLMGTYGDKESVLKVFKRDRVEGEKLSIEKIKEEFQDQYSKAGGFTIEGKSIEASDINKRETALVSKEKVFEEVKIPMDIEILEPVRFGDRFEKDGKVLTKMDGEKINPFDDILVKIDEDVELGNNGNIKTYIERIKNLDPTLNKELDKYDDIAELQSHVETTYFTDGDDGTSFATKSLFDIHAGIKGTENNGHPKKWHMQGKIGEDRMLGKTLFNQVSLAKKYTGEGWKTITKPTVFLGDSSMKLKGGYVDDLSGISVKDAEGNEREILSFGRGEKQEVVKYGRKTTTVEKLLEELRGEKSRLIEIDGQQYRTVGKISGADTSFFKDAASEAQTIKADQTVTEQAVNLMSFDVKREYEAEIYKDIKNAYDEILGGLGNYDFDLPTFGDVNLFLANLQKKYQVGGTTDTVIFSRIKKFLDTVNNIVGGAKAPGYSQAVLFNRIKLPSNEYLGKGISKKFLERDEVVVSNQSDLYISTKKKVQELRDQLDLKTELTEKENDALDLFNKQLDSGEFIVTGLRNPIPNVENLGVYKLIPAEKVGYNKGNHLVSGESVILHPESNFMKFQGDNDGDHVVFFPATTKKGGLLARTALGHGMADGFEKVLLDGAFENKVASIKQIPSVKGDVKMDIIDGSLKNLKAKVNISNASSIIRGINILSQYIDEYKASAGDIKRQQEILDLKLKGEEFGEFKVDKKTEYKLEKNYSIGEIIKTLYDTEVKAGDSLQDNVFAKSDKYGGEVGSVLQKVLDFAKDKSGKPFPKDWFKDIFAEIGVKDEAKIKFLFNDVLSPMGLSHKSGGKILKTSKINQLWFTPEGKTYGEKEYKNLKSESDVLNSTMGFRRNVLNFVGDKYAKNLSNLKNSIESRFLLEKEFLGEIDGKIVDGLGLESKGLSPELNQEVIDTVKNVLENDKFLGPEVRGNIERLYAKISEASPELESLRKKFVDTLDKNTHEETGRINYHKSFIDLDIIDQRGYLKIDNETRNFYALYSMAQGNNTMFNLLNQAEKINLLEFSEEAAVLGRTEYTPSINIFNESYEPTLYLSKFPEEKQIRDQLASDKLQIEEKLNETNFNISVVKQQLELDIAIDINKIDADEAMEIDEYGLLSALNSLSDKKNLLTNISKKVRDLDKTLSKNIEAYQAKQRVKEDFKQSLEVKKPDVSYLDNFDIKYKIGTTTMKNILVDSKRMGDIDTLFREGTKLKAVDVLEKYDIDFTAKMNTARELFRNEALVMKKTLVDTTEKLTEEINKAGFVKGTDVTILKLIKGDTKKHYIYSSEGYRFDTEGYLEDMTSKLEGKAKTREYTPEEKTIIMKYATKLSDEVFEGLAVGLTKMDNHYKDQGGYKIKYGSQLNSVFLEDLLNSFNGDLEFQFRRTGELNALGSAGDNFVTARKEFIAMMKTRADNQGITFNSNEVNKIFDLTFYKKENALLKMVTEVQAIDYSLKYQFPSLLLGGTGHIAGLTQIPGNMIEVISGTARIKYDKEIHGMLDFLGVTAEDTLAVGQGAEFQLADTFISKFQKKASVTAKEQTKKIMRKFGSNDKILEERVANIIDSGITEPLLATDAIQDGMRREASMQYVAELYGVKKLDDLKDILITSADKDKFKSLFYRKYNEIGGSVISSSNIYRENLLTVVNSQKGGYAAKKIFVGLFRYLNGWSISKVSTMAEKSMMIPQAIKLYRAGDKAGADILMKEFTNYTTSLISNIGMALGLAMKFEKYDYTGGDEEVNNSDFITNITNNLVALEILFDREIENMKGVHGDDYQTRVAVTTLELLKHLTRSFKIAKIPATINNRMDTLDEGLMEATYKGIQSVIGSYIRNAHGLAIGNIYEESTQQDNIALFGYGMGDKLDDMNRKVSQAKTSAKVSSIGVDGALLDMLFNFVTPQYLGNEAINFGVKKMLSDENIRSLYSDGIGTNGYNLDTLLLTDGELDSTYIKKAWNEMIVYQSVGERFDDQGRKISGDTTIAYDTKMDDIITKQLEVLGYTKEDFLNKPSTRTTALQKLYLEHTQNNIPELSTQHLTSYIANNKYYEAVSELKDLRGVTSLEAVDKDLAKYITLKDLSDSGILNANKQNLQAVSGLHVQKNDSELYEFLQDAKSNSGLQSYMDGLLLSTQNLKEGDTNARLLTSRYAKGLKGMLNFYHPTEGYTEPSAEALEIMTDASLTYIREIINSSQPGKEQTAKIAAVLSGLDSAGWNMLRDNDTFNLLTLPAQRKLMSWVYKAHNELDTYDANSISNYSSYTGSGYSSYMPNSYSYGSSSGYSSGARPGFGSQFPGIKQFAQARPNMIPQNYERIARDFLPKKNLELAYLNFPVVRAINNHYIQETYKALTTPGTQKIKTKKAYAKAGYVKTKKGTRKLASTGRVSKTTSKIRKTTVKGLPGDISDL